VYRANPELIRRLMERLGVGRDIAEHLALRMKQAPYEWKFLRRLMEDDEESSNAA
jgi:hypothetical protein